MISICLGCEVFLIVKSLCLFLGQPKGALTGDDCGEMVAAWNYEWNDQNCHTRNPWICKKIGE